MSHICRSQEDVNDLVEEIWRKRDGRKYLLPDEIRILGAKRKEIITAMEDARKLLIKSQTMMSQTLVGRISSVFGGPIGAAASFAQEYIAKDGLRKQYGFVKGTFRESCASLYFFGYRECADSSDLVVVLLPSEPIQFPYFKYTV